MHRAIVKRKKSSAFFPSNIEVIQWDLTIWYKKKSALYIDNKSGALLKT
jgi:hypothetical protein